MVRRHRGSARFVAALSAVLLLILTACGAAKPATPTTPTPGATPAPAPAQPAQQLNEWVVAFSEDITTMDPYVAAGGAIKWNAQLHVFEPLVGVEGPKLELVPRLAQSWSYINPTTLEMKLRQGVKFHNGDAFTADDVVYSFKLMSTDATLGNTAALATVDRLEKVDDFTIRFITKTPAASLIPNMSQILPIVPKGRAANVEAFTKRPIGTGMYKMAADYVRDQPVQLVANDAYWGGAPKPAKLTFKFIREPSTRVAELMNGTIHAAENISLPQVDMLKGGDKTSVVSAKGARIMYYSFNLSKAPFDNVKVRQALNHAINREVIVKNVLLGYGAPLTGLFAPGWMGYDPNLQPYAYDLAKAKALLAEAGLPNGFEFEWIITDGVFLKDREIAEAVANQLKQIGVTAKLRILERATIYENMYAGTFDLVSGQWPLTSDPDRYLQWLFIRQVVDKDKKVITPILDGIKEAAAIVDPAKRQTKYAEISKFAHDQAVLMEVHVQDELYGVNKAAGWTPAPLRSLGTQHWYAVHPSIKR